MNSLWALMGFLFTCVMITILIIVPAFGAIWALNTLFHLGIGYGAMEWLAMNILLILSGAVKIGSNNREE